MSDATTLEPTEPQDGKVHSGFSAIVQGKDVAINGGGALIIAAGQDMRIMGGGGSIIAAGRDMSITSGGGSVLAAGNNISVQNGGGALVLTSNATVSRGFVAVLLSGKVELREGSRVLLGTPQAAALGAAFGLVFALVARRGRRK